MPYFSKAFIQDEVRERKEWLYRVQTLIVEGGESGGQASSGQAVIYIGGEAYTLEEIHEAIKLLYLILRRSSVIGNGSNIMIKLKGTINPRKKPQLTRILEAAGLL